MPRLSRKHGPDALGTEAKGNGTAPSPRLPVMALRCTLCTRKLSELKWAAADSPLGKGDAPVALEIQCPRCKTKNRFEIRN